jgi:hypothetical protein
MKLIHHRNEHGVLLKNLEHGLILFDFVKLRQAHYLCSREAQDNRRTHPRMVAASPFFNVIRKQVLQGLNVFNCVKAI